MLSTAGAPIGSTRDRRLLQTKRSFLREFVPASWHNSRNLNLLHLMRIETTNPTQNTREKCLRRLWFQQNGLNERVTVEGEYAGVLRKGSRTTTLGYQMPGGGKFLDQQTGDRRKCFERAIGEGFAFVEVYRQDLVDPKWQSAIEYMASGLDRKARISSPK
jgi:hypothetical protein